MFPSSDDLDWMRQLQAQTLPHQGRVLRREDGQPDQYNMPKSVYYPEAEGACGYRALKLAETSGAQAPDVHGLLRLPHGTSIKQSDRFAITALFGVTLSTPEVYDVISPPENGPTAVRVTVRRLTGAEQEAIINVLR